ncbi:MAG: glycoside hydrolase [Kiritimatiellales bacterium]|nr:glycoside hydrolase [Kiritimatiellales bacterium]
MKNFLIKSGFVFLISAVTALADAKTPYPSADDYPQMPYINRNPGPEYADSARKFQGIPSIVVAPGGRLWVTWYGGGEGESSENYVLLATSGDNGETWSGPKMVIDPPFRASEPALWLDPQNRMWFMWNLYPVRSSALEQKQAKERFPNIDAYNEFIGKFSFAASQLWVMTTDNPDAENPVWSEPRLIAMETHNMNKPSVLADGTWLWPATPLPSSRPSMPRPLFSTDGGKTFRYRGEIPLERKDMSASEYQVVERKDGSLWMLNRTQYGIGESFSSDGGKTWTPTAPSKIIQAPSRFFITRLNSGKLLLVKHGPIDQNVGRSQLMAFLSDDDGKSWSKGLMLDERTDISYPDGMQTPDGTIYITYDRSRAGEREILMTTFAEKDIQAGAYVTAGARQKVIINKAGGAYEVNFTNDDKADGPISQVGWHANYDADGKAVSESNSGLLRGPVLSWVDYIVYDLDAATFGSKPLLLWTDNASFGSIDKISSFSVSLKNDEETADLKVAIKVDDAWYVTQDVLNAGVSKWTVHTLDVHSVSWNTLSFIPGSELAEGGKISLPASGAITAIGIFDANETSVKTRIDRIMVQ